MCQKTWHLGDFFFRKHERWIFFYNQWKVHGSKSDDDIIGIEVKTLVQLWVENLSTLLPFEKRVNFNQLNPCPLVIFSPLKFNCLPNSFQISWLLYKFILSNDFPKKIQKFKYYSLSGCRFNSNCSKCKIFKTLNCHKIWTTCSNHLKFCTVIQFQMWNETAEKFFPESHWFAISISQGGPSGDFGFFVILARTLSKWHMQWLFSVLILVLYHNRQLCSKF